MEKYGLIGYPLGHSFSMNYFNEKFENEGLDALYMNFEISTIEEFPEIIASNPELCGLNVTIPYKEKIIKYLDDISPEAKEIGAVNVVRVSHKGGKAILKGYNSDVIGFMHSIEAMIEPFHKKALILGTGGASKAVNYGLRKLGLETIFVSRTQKPNAITYDDVTAEMIDDYNVIVNCTPLGMFPKIDTCPAIPYEALTSRNILYDLIYNPNDTLFLQYGEKHGAATKNGIEMLLLQAFASWEFWHENK